MIRRWWSKESSLKVGKGGAVGGWSAECEDREFWLGQGLDSDPRTGLTLPFPQWTLLGLLRAFTLFLFSILSLVTAAV